MHQNSVTCKNCGNRFEGNYCNNCGEKVYDEHHKKLGHVFEEAFHFITHLDGTLFTTIKAVFTKPGKLSYDICNGVRKKYFKPVSFFLLCVVLYLLFPRFEGLNMRMDTYLNAKYGYTPIASPVAAKKMKNKSLSYEQMREKYDQKSPKISKIMLLTLLPLIAAVLYLLFFRQRRYYFDHFIYAAEFGSFWISIKFLLLPAIMSLVMLINPAAESFFNDDNWIPWVLLHAITVAVLIIAFKRFYGQNWLWSIIKAIAFFVIFTLLIMNIYNILLFLTVMLFI